MDATEGLLDARPGSDDPLLRRAIRHLHASLGAPTTMQVGRYRLIRRLGAGGFGSVWQAHDPLLRRDVAIKVLHAELGEAVVHQMRHEAQALAALSHPNVVACFGVGVDVGIAYLAMQLVRGCDLAAWLRVPRRSHEILRVFGDAARGLAAAHALRIVHRDVKPANILIAEDGSAAVTDFGVARAWREPSTQTDERTPAATAVAGTPLYMAPEQLSGRPATPASDVFALAASLYEAFAGVPAFHGRSHAELLEQKLRGRLNRPLPGRSLPLRVQDAVLRGLDPDPDRRPGAIELMRQAMPRRRGALVMWAAFALVPVGALATAEDATPCGRAPASMASVPGELAPAVGHRRKAIDDARREACDAFAAGALARTELEAKLSCLDERSRDVDDVALAVQATGATAEESTRLLAEMPGAVHCTRHTWTSGDDDDEAAADRTLLVRARALVDEQMGVARELATEVLARAEAAGRSRLQAEALVVRGMASLTRLDVAGSIDDLQHGYWIAHEAGDDLVAARAAALLVRTVERGGRRGESEAWQRHAEAVIERLPEPDWLRAELESAIAETALDRGEIAAAIAANDRMMAAWERVAAREGVSLANAWLSSAEILVGARRPDAAERAARRALEVARTETTPRRVFALQVRVALAEIEAARGRADEAIAILRAVVPAIADAVDHDDVRVFTARSILVGHLLTAGELAEARAHLETQVATARAALPDDHLEVARALAQLGHVEHTVGQREAGRAHLLEAMAIFEAHPPSLDALIAYGSLAELSVNEDDHAAVVRWLERGVAVATVLLPADHPIRLQHEAGLWAARASATGDRAAFAQVAALRPRLSDDAGAAVDQARAFAYRRHGDFAAAEALDRAALAAAERSGSRRELAHARFSLAQSLEGLDGDPDEVARLFAAACAHFRDPATFEAHFAKACEARARS